MGHVERDAAQRVDGGVARSVDAFDIPRADGDALPLRLLQLSGLARVNAHEFVYSKALRGVKCA